MTKGNTVLYIKFNSRRELWDYYKRLNTYTGGNLSYKVYNSLEELQIHYVGINIGNEVLLNKEYEFISGVYTNHPNNKYKSYLFFTYKFYQKIRKMYKYTFFNKKQNKEFIKEFEILTK